MQRATGLITGSAVGAVVALLLVGPLLACDTPVYRYAMYRWVAAPYEVYHFHQGKPETATGVRKRIEDESRGETGANVVFIDVDLSAKDALERIPPDVKAVWSQRTQRPDFLISTPKGIEVFGGELGDDQVERLVDSKARRALAKQLEAGKAGVLLLLTGKDAKRNAEVEGLLKKLADDIEQGKVSLYSSPAPGEPATDQSKSKVIQVGVMKVDRQDEAEQWLVRNLLSVEGDLRELDEPMVFAVYGRARALPPYIGKGITRDNLLDCIEFITGACSCTVKEQNPGVDLLVRHDWETAAAAVAEKFGAEEGNESQFGAGDGFFPDLIIPAAPVPGEGTTDDPTDRKPEPAAPSESPAEDRTDGASASGDENPGDANPGDANPGNLETGDANPGNANPGETNNVDPTSNDPAAEGPVASGDEVGTRVASSARPEATNQTASQAFSSWAGMLVIAAALGLGLVVLLAATFAVLWPR